jgi:hypothetical protein
MSTATLTCAQLQTSRWLGAATAGSQVVEIVLSGAPKLGTIQAPPGEVNYAAGGKSSSYEESADSGSITFTKVEADTVVEGTVDAAYGDGSHLTGNFHATFCAHGQGF